MTPKAIVQGEIHTAQRDQQNLYDQRTEETDALFIEGRSDSIELEHKSAGYLIFLLGYVSLELFYLLTRSLGKTLPTTSEWSIRKAAKGEGWPIHTDIDAELHEMWEMTDREIRWVLYVVAAIMGAIALVQAIFDMSVLIFPDSLFPAVVIVLIPFVYSGFAVVLLGGDEQRDEIMSESIKRETEGQDYSEVLILCGDSHVEGITERLEESGWEVVPKRSTHPIAKVSRAI